MTNTTIGIIGSGMIGANVARLAIAAGLDIVICNSRGPETLSELISDLGSNANAATIEDVINSSDLIVLAVPFPAYTNLPVDLLAGKTLIDTLNYYPQRDGEMPEVKTEHTATSEMVQSHLANSHVIRALNNVDFVRLLSSARPAGASDRSALPVAGNDPLSKDTVIKFLDKIGYDAFDMGPLSESWRSEPTTPVYVAPYMHSETSYVAQKVTVEIFKNAPGRTVTRDEVEILVKAAVRHDKMFGKLPEFAQD
ncbi:NADPH-dependent F420 reductase [Rahnella sp. PCH160]|uniref:NADPH-dependent F420 reductase n=1 Tax=Rahnella sp. PCH160 TaxID=3447928 RepID=UPI0039FCBFD3